MAGNLPHVLIIYPDQLRADTIGCSGNPAIKTPHINRLAQEGIRFSEAYTSFPLCTPFRASLFTGKYAHSNGACANHYPVPLDQTFLASLMKERGYRTGYIGKWHLDGGIKYGYIPPGKRRLGFDHFVGFNRGHEYANPVFYRDSEQPLKSSRYEPDYQTDHLIEFMEESLISHPEDPFFGMISYGPPHFPNIAPPNYLNLYSPDEVALPAGLLPDAEMREKAVNFLAPYYGLISCIDFNIGRILNWLDSSGIAEDTLVIFISDHGDMAGEHGIRPTRKKTYYRGAMQVPFIMRYPRRWKEGKVVEGLVDPSVDIMPTLLELLGMEIPAAVQGVSILRNLDEAEAVWNRDEIYYEIVMQREGPEKFPVPQRGVRTRDWLYVCTPDGALALFDERNDPNEMENLAGRPEYQVIQARLHAALMTHMEKLGDSWDVEAVFPPPDFMTHEEGAEYVKQLNTRARVEN